jgi:hypothetical protein
MSQKRIVCTVTNGLNYDQRMIRVCTSLSEEEAIGYLQTIIS